ncbi:MAG: ribonuclease H-like domain-containing protein [Deltaproteobacteria bacterium]|nr:ribonuclease H-like domain-containing protein [Deltaproteobacteria bacterium]
MNVIKRLQRLTGEEAQAAKKEAPTEQLSELRRRVETIMARRPERRGPLDAPSGSAVSVPPRRGILCGEEQSNAYGNFFLSQRHHDGSHNHGGRSIREFRKSDMKMAALLARSPQLAEFGIADGLFLDVETTGLSGGTGTIAFLIGLGWFDGEGFVTGQIFARDFSEERAALAYLQQISSEKRFLVTFNGKAFDVNILAARFVMNRLSDTLSAIPHLDLLHPCRRLLGHRLENCRLMTIEEAVVGLRRNGDIPGSEIPERYFNWLRFRDEGLLTDVFEHNRLDVISMAALTFHLTKVLGPDPMAVRAHHRDLQAAARFMIERRHMPEARRILRDLITAGNRSVRRDARRALSLLEKRTNHWQEAIALWRAMLQEDPDDFFALEELAKWYEHRCRDIERAVSLVGDAVIRQACKSESESKSFSHRLRRLTKKMKRPV